MNDPIYNEATYNDYDTNECEYCGEPCSGEFCNDNCRRAYAQDNYNLER